MTSKNEIKQLGLKYWFLFLIATFLGSLFSYLQVSSQPIIYKASLTVNEYGYFNDEGTFKVADVKIGFPGMHYYLGTDTIKTNLLRKLSVNDIEIVTRMNLWQGKATLLFKSQYPLNDDFLFLYIEMLNHYIREQEVIRLSRIKNTINATFDAEVKNDYLTLFSLPQAYQLFDYVSIVETEKIKPKLNSFALISLGGFGALLLCFSMVSWGSSARKRLEKS